MQRIRSMAPDFAERAIASLQESNFDPGIIEQIVQGLTRAGLELKQPAPATQ